ncbi:MAG TPA: HAD family hydrolase [Myxococcales bacterium]|nr:HAD family hydrolase [Myxococcales bacterium]
MPAQALLFDIDGTLVDSVDLHARAWQEAFAHFGKRVAFDAVRAQIGKGGDQLMKEFLSRDELEKRGAEIEEYRSDLYKREYLGKVHGFPCVRELFQELRRRKLRIALASSAKGDELQTYKKIAKIDDLIETETSADDAERSKPHPDIFEAALQQLGPDIEKARTYVIGDSPWDAIAATRLGVRTIGVLCGGFPEPDLRRAGCVAVYRDPADLLSRLDESPIVR